MKILLVNDDGIDSQGILDLGIALQKEHEITIVAPDKERSGSSHSITIYENLVMEPREFNDFSGKAWSINGTPVDCTRVGLEYLSKGVDLVISGINRGYNAGIDTLYSGTVSAALEAHIYGKAAMAVSAEYLHDKEETNYLLAVEETVKLVQRLGSRMVQERMLLNFNIPYALTSGEIKVCSVGDPVFYKYFVGEEEGQEALIAKGRIERKLTSDTDRYYLERGYMTLSPMEYNFTDREALKDLHRIFF